MTIIVFPGWSLSAAAWIVFSGLVTDPAVAPVAIFVASREITLSKSEEGI